MNDMSQVIIAKSDQLNGDDLISGPITVKISGVKITAGTEQPVAIHYEGDGGKPWKCCKSMSRVLVSAWGPDASKYIGKSVTLYRDPTVKWGGMEVGGIRISHMSDIDRDMVIALTATRGNKKPFTVKPLGKSTTKKAAPKLDPDFDPDAFVESVKQQAIDATEASSLDTWWNSPETTAKRKFLAQADQDKSQFVRSLVADRIGELEAGKDV